MGNRARRRPPRRPITALLLRRIAGGVAPGDHLLPKHVRALDAVLARRPLPAWARRDPNVAFLDSLDSLLWTVVELRKYVDDIGCDEIIWRWETFDDLIAAGRLTRAAWANHETGLHALLLIAVGDRYGRRRAADAKASQAFAPILAERRARADATKTAYREAAASLIQRGLSRSVTVRHLARNPPPGHGRAAVVTIRRYIRDLT